MGMPPSCNRARALLSERLDGALSQVERRAAARHLAGCASCREFDAQSRWLANELRARPLEPLPRPVVVPRLRTSRVTSRLVGNIASAAALLVVVVGGYAIVTESVVNPKNELGIKSSAAAGAAQGDPLRALRVDALRAGELRILPKTPPPVHVKPVPAGFDR